jgi:hypothetical protein
VNAGLASGTHHQLLEEIMKPKYRKLAIALMTTIAITLSGAVSVLRADTGNCGGGPFTLPFTDVSGNGFFCQIAAAYFSGLTNGTTPTTYSPNDPVPRAQMAAFVTRTLDQSLKRGSERAALGEWWTPQPVSEKINLGADAQHVVSDGEYVYATAYADGGGAVRKYTLEGEASGLSWQVSHPRDLVYALGYLWVTGSPTASDGKLYRINPHLNTAPDEIDISGHGDPRGIAFDGERLWIAFGGGGIGILNLKNYTGQVIHKQFNFSTPRGVLFDGSYIWIADGDHKLKRLNPDASINLEVLLLAPKWPVFDGANIWVPTHNAVVVVRATGAAAGTVLATLTGHALPIRAAFDGERVLVTNSSSDSVTLYKATDFSLLGTFAVGDQPWGVCSDGLNFWVALAGEGKLVRL